MPHWPHDDSAPFSPNPRKTFCLRKYWKVKSGRRRRPSVERKYKWLFKCKVPKHSNSWASNLWAWKSILQKTFNLSLIWTLFNDFLRKKICTYFFLKADLPQMVHSEEFSFYSPHIETKLSLTFIITTFSEIFLC